jgi:hypothetical protein
MRSAKRSATEPRAHRVTGRLDRLDAHGELAGTLRDDEGAARRCLFPAELEPELRHPWRRRVEVEGTLERARGRKERGPIRVARIRTLAEPFEEAAPSPGRPPSLLAVLATLEPLEEDFPAIDELPLRSVEVGARGNS